MADFWSELGEKAKGLVGSWATYSAVGSFGVYVLGYLSLRFHLTALGVGTDLAVLDERYLFTGAKFLVYLLACIPHVLVYVLVVALPVLGIIYSLYRIICWIIDRSVGWAAREKVSGFFDRKRPRFTPNRLAIVGIILSVALIQFVMRHCFLYSNLLLAPDLPAHWMRPLLLDDQDALTPDYFGGLIVGTGISAFFLLAAIGRVRKASVAAKALIALLATLVAIEILLLPVSYGIIIMGKELPKVADLGGSESLKDGQEAWLVWEGIEGVTYLLRTNAEGEVKKRLVTLARKEIKRTEIVQYDPILRVLFVE